MKQKSKVLRTHFKNFFNPGTLCTRTNFEGLPEFLLAERQPALVHVDVGLGLQPARQPPPGGVRGAAGADGAQGDQGAHRGGQEEEEKQVRAEPRSIAIIATKYPFKCSTIHVIGLWCF